MAEKQKQAFLRHLRCDIQSTAQFALFLYLALSVQLE